MADVIGGGERGPVQRYLHLDVPLLVLLALLAGGGLVVLYSAFDGDGAQWQRQLWRLGAAFVVLLVLAQVPPGQLRRLSPSVYAAGVVSLLLVAAFGSTAGGAQRWLDLGVMMVQPSELLKLALPMMVAWLLAREGPPPRLRAVALVLAVILVPVGLIAAQPDLGTAVVVGAAGIFALFLGGLGWRYVLGGGLLVGGAAPILWLYGMHDYQRQRVLTFLDPERDPLGAGYHIIQSKIAIGSGGFYGKGWMAGTQSHLEFLPERHTDFVFAVLAEEFGFFGVCVLLALYLAVVGRGLWIAGQAQDNFSRLLAGSMTLTFFVYGFVNMGMVSGLLPVVGLPLPLVSFGGTSLVTLMAGFGILMSIHTHRRMWSSS
ncbi:rod shape-determining protein RodA [Arhodomonas sp. SL1]|uniref:rod shape-determining protein RodA n=1 Tax=Arhodomonas sp. SL1 TaxID=3425691 RepID=UPI003F881BE9